MSGIMEKTVNEIISFNRPYEVEKRLNQSYVNFRVISEYFMNVIMKEFINKEHKEAINLNRKFDLTGRI